MVNTMMRLTLVGALIVALCGAVAADVSIAPSWLGSVGASIYTWDAWGGVTGQTSYTLAPDSSTGEGTASALVSIGDGGAGLLSGPEYAIGSRDRYLELGPAGSIHVDVTSRGTVLWITTSYHEDVSVAPEISVEGASLIASRLVMLEDTTLDPLYHSQWTRYEALWSLGPGSGGFQAIDVLADPMTGSNIEAFSLATYVPEPSSIVALAMGMLGFVGVARRRRA